MNFGQKVRILSVLESLQNKNWQADRYRHQNRKSLHVYFRLTSGWWVWGWWICGWWVCGFLQKKRHDIFQWAIVRLRHNSKKLTHQRVEIECLERRNFEILFKCGTTGKENWVAATLLRRPGVCPVNPRHARVPAGLLDNPTHFGIDEYRRDAAIVFPVVLIWDVFLLVNCHVRVFGFSEVVINFVQFTIFRPNVYECPRFRQHVCRLFDVIVENYESPWRDVVKTVIADEHQVDCVYKLFVTQSINEITHNIAIDFFNGSFVFIWITAIIVPLPVRVIDVQRHKLRWFVRFEPVDDFIDSALRRFRVIEDTMNVFVT